jgi:hypothetical protein
MDLIPLAGRIVLCALLLAPALASAGYPLASEEPETQGKGAVMVESNVNYLKDNEFKSTVAPLAVTLGINDTMDLGVEMPYLWLRPSGATGQPQSGFGDVFFKFKHRFYEEEKRNDEGGKSEYALGYMVSFSQPTGREELGLGAGTERWAVRLLGLREGESVEVIANLGFESSGRALMRGNFVFDYAVFGSIAVEYEGSKPWEPVAELVVIRVKGEDGYERIATAVVGMIYEPSESFYVAAAVRVGLNEQSEDYALQAGFGYKF